MKLIVNAHKIDLIPEELVNEKEVNISKCEFEFSEEYTDDLVKEAYFTLLDGNNRSYKQIIVNNECSYPPEVLVEKGTVEIGVVAYKVDGDEYIELYNPSPAYFQTLIGSLKDHAENSQPITPSELEQYEQALEDGLAEVQNVDIDASKTGNTATVTITNRYGEQKEVEIYDGEQGQPGTTPNIQVGTTTTLPAGSNATVTQSGTAENPIFNFGIPKGQDGESGGVSDYTELSNKPKINNVELNGNKTTSELGIVIPDVSDFITKDVDDLTNYYKKTETYTKTEVDNKVSSVYRYRGTVQTYNDLPSTDLVIGDVYNVEQADSQHGIEAGDNVAWNGTVWDKLSGNVDLSGYQPLLVSGTNIKTVNNENILGSGNLEIKGSKCVIIPFYNYTDSSVVSALDEVYQEYLLGNIIPVYVQIYGGSKLINVPVSIKEGTATAIYLVSDHYIDFDSGGVNYDKGYTIKVQLTISNGHISSVFSRTINSVDVSSSNGKILKHNNAYVYTPTANSYNPATTKYVDEAIAGISTGQIIQYSTVPTASADNLGQIIQFTGTTDSTYINGYFYKCVSDGNDEPTYSWENINIQASIAPKSCEYIIEGNNVIIFIARALAGLSIGDHRAINSYINTVLNDTNINGKSGITLSIQLVDAWFYTIDTIDLTTNGNKSPRCQIATETTKISGTTSFSIRRTNGVVDYNSWSNTIFNNLPLRYLGTSNTTAYTPSNDYNPATKKYVDDAIAGSSGGQTIQYDTMPTASSTNEGDIVQFVGTTGTYTNGYFYKCVSDGAAIPSYDWVAIDTQETYTGRYMVNGDTVIYKMPAGTYYLEPDNKTSQTNANINFIELGKAVGIAYANNKKLAIQTYSSSSGGNWFFIGNTVPATGNATYEMYGRTTSSTGNNWLTKLTITYTRPNNDFVISSAKYSGYTHLSLGFNNSFTFEPNYDSYNPATAKYAESMTLPIAPRYAKNTPYAVGDYVTQYNKLYVCNTAIPSGENWNANHWTETTVASILGNLETALSNITTGNGV